mmetsp:Transcript_19693/g.27695  ORF Transcript_19693/g.27695 Transcript_19693/m.27695 type:complete len:420 (-) Transcript_19693:14-1273(-)
MTQILIQALALNFAAIMLILTSHLRYQCQASWVTFPFSRFKVKPTSSFLVSSIHSTQYHNKFHSSSSLNLNRFLFDLEEINEIEVTKERERIPIVTLPKEDYRTIHAAKTLGLLNGDFIRAGVVLDSGDHSYKSSTSLEKKTNVNLSGIEDKACYAGLITDEAQIEWLAEGKIKKPQPTKNGKPPGSLRIILKSLTVPFNNIDSHFSQPSSNSIGNKHSISLILALPRPLQLGRILPMVAQMGIDHLVLISAQKVPKDYFGSHLLRTPTEIRRLLIEGLCQAGDVNLPRITVAKQFKAFVEDDLDSLFPKNEWARVIAHPQRLQDSEKPARFRDIEFPIQNDHEAEGTGNVAPKVVLAVGPEGGWAEPYELDKFKEQGFQQVTLGPRILRSDVAVISLLTLAQDVCFTEQNRGNLPHPK